MPLSPILTALLTITAPLAGVAPPTAGASVVRHERVAAPAAQALVDRVVASNPDMLDVLMHVRPPHRPDNLVIAAHLTHAVGEVSGDDDLGVMRTAHPLVEVQKDGVRIGVLVPLHDAHRRTIGALGLMFPYRPGEDQAAVLRRALAIRDTLAPHVPSRDALFA